MNSKRLIPLLLSLFLAWLPVCAQAQDGIKFEHNAWAEIVAKAKAEGKLIFADVYTQWCGPCYNMATTVFTRHDVGAFYNDHFVCVKTDAENGEGVALARKYQVRVYPTYLYIDPQTEEFVHRSSSVQTPENFIRTGKNSLDPKTRSTYLESEYAKGNRSRQFLLDYIAYQFASHQRDKVATAFDQLIAGGAKLTDKDVWPVFDECVSGLGTYLRQVSDNYDEFCRLFTKKAVDAKLARETRYGDADAVAALCDYEGKAFNLDMIKLNKFTRGKQYDEAAKIIDRLMGDSLIDRKEFMRQLSYTVRGALYDKETPADWYMRCVGYMRYIAYNWPDRDDATMHQLYAATLEDAIVRNPATLRQTIQSKPAFGVADYNMRPAALKPKPKPKRTK